MKWQVLTWIALFASGLCPAQTPATQPDAAVSTTQSADGDALLRIRVIHIVGKPDVLVGDATEPQPCRVGEEYFAPVTIRTGQFQSVTVKIGDEEPETIVQIDPNSWLKLSEAGIVKGTKNTRVNLGYGKVRGGVAEGGIPSNFTIETPNATQSKAGTWNFGIEYERGTGRYRAFLLDRGLAFVRNHDKHLTRELAVGQSVTQDMRLWSDESQIRRNVPVPDVLGQEDIQIAFNRRNNSGLGLLQPGDGRRPIFELTQRTEGGAFSLFNRRNGGVPVFTPPRPIDIEFPPIRRPEGDFGTGRGVDLLGNLFGARSRVRSSAISAQRAPQPRGLRGR